MNKLYVGNFKDKISEHMIIKIFKEFGEIIDLQFIWHREGPLRVFLLLLKGLPKGFCFITYSSVEVFVI